MKQSKVFNIFTLSVLMLMFFVTPVHASYIVTSVIKDTQLREYCGTDAKAIQNVNKNSIIEIMNIQDNWAKVIYNTHVGYINMDFVDKTKIKGDDYDYYVIVQAVPIELKDTTYGNYIEDKSVEEEYKEPVTGDTSSNTIIPTEKSHVDYTDWSKAQKIFTVNQPAEVYDVLTGLTYYVKSFSNGNHADVEPVTKDDTAIMFETFGFEWSWDVRPVWVTINGATMAGSINGMPHAKGVNDDNGMDGQICIHFLNSKTHNGNQDYTELHQKVAKEAFELSLK